MPVVLDDIWLPGAPFKGLTAERLLEHRGPVVRLVRDRVRRAHDPRRRKRSGRWRPMDEAAELLQVTPGQPLLSVERLSLHLWRQAGGASARP